MGKYEISNDKIKLCAKGLLFITNCLNLLTVIRLLKSCTSATMKELLCVDNSFI